MTSPSTGRRFPNVEGPRTVRAPRRGSLPLVSVVVASTEEWPLLQRYLGIAADECVRARAELVVARPAIAPDADSLARMYPTAGFVEGPKTASIAELRAIGMREATGDIVVFVEDLAEFDAAHLDAFVRHAQRQTASAEGGVRLEVNWTAYLAHYGVMPSSSAKSGTGETEGARPPTTPGASAGRMRRLRTWLARAIRTLRRRRTSSRRAPRPTE